MGKMGMNNENMEVKLGEEDCRFYCKTNTLSEEKFKTLKTQSPQKHERERERGESKKYYFYIKTKKCL